jgi:hypothetical protein
MVVGRPSWVVQCILSTPELLDTSFSTRIDGTAMARLFELGWRERHLVCLRFRNSIELR